MPKAIWNGTVIAESNDVIEVEGNSYFPVSSVNKAYLVASEHHTVCGWKGQASYFHVEVDGQRNDNAAWYYAAPENAAASIAGRVAFWKGVKVEP